jgi:crossover junction endodeoxyribonuclease RusA
VNTYWRRVVIGKRAATILSKRGREFRAAAVQLASGHKAPAGRLAVRVDLHPPDKRRRDLDNCAKAILDALAHAGVFEDDSLIDDLRLVRREIVKGGSAVVSIRPMGQALPS